MATQSATSPQSFVDSIMSKTFCQGRAARSTQYKAGVRALLVCRIDKTPFSCPYAIGTVEADAFFAGADEGRVVWSELLRAGRIAA